MGTKKYTIEQIRKAFESEGYQLLTTEYKNAHVKLDFICPNGHNHSISWSEFNNNNSRCGRCKGNIEVTYEQVKSSFEAEGYQLLSIDYINAHSKLDYICSNGHKHFVNWSHWNGGVRCGKCFGNKEVSIERVRDSFESEGYQLLSTEYKNCRQKLKFICPNGHKHSITWNNWSDGGRRCGKCNNSKPETQLLNYIKFAYPYIKVIHQDRNQIYNPSTGRGLEFDIWLPELNKAIEMDGVKVHSFKDKVIRDSIKNQLCKEKGIPLLRITDEEWYTSEVVRTKIHKFVHPK